MRHLNNIFTINPLTIIYIIIGIISNQGYYLFIYYFIGLIHELFHCLTAWFLDVKVDEITFLPFGFIAKIGELEFQKEWKQYLILILGPLSFFFSMLFNELLFRNGIFSAYSYNYAKHANLSTLIVNLLPIYPLDGEKIIENIFSHFLNELDVRKFRIVISFITMVVSMYFMFSLGNLVSFAFLLVILVSNLINLRKNYILYLVTRIKNKIANKKKIVRNLEIFRFYDNYMFTKNGFIKEERIIKNILLSSKNEKNIK